MNRLELRTGQKPGWVVDDQSVTQTYLPEDHQSNRFGSKHKAKEPIHYVYDHVFNTDSDNNFIYDMIGAPVVESCMRGFHGCMFAYGQTSSGKTYTIHGSSQSPGMIPQSIEHVFQWIEQNPQREFVLRVSYMEIYNEIVNDLLNASNTNLRIREDRIKGVYVEGLKEEIVMAADQVFSLLHAGTAHRHIGRTNYNDVSSRSHTIFRITVESSKRNSVTGAVRFSSLNLVDLAGSENAVKAGSSERMAETGYINKSLLTLGHVIYKLSEKNTSHIPYRDSKLTRILQSSLGGKAKIAVCCNISPSNGNLEETISTLKFANRAKRVTTTAKVNEKMDDSALLRKYRIEIENLKEELLKYKMKDEEAHAAPAAPSEPAVDVKEILAKQEQEKMELNAKIDALTRLILHSSAPPVDKSGSSSGSGSAAANSDLSGTGTSDSSAGAGAGGRNRLPPAHLIRRPAAFKEKRRNTIMGYYTLPRSFTQPVMHIGENLERRPSLTKLFQDPDVDEEVKGGDDDANDLLCDAPQRKAPGGVSASAAGISSVDGLREKLSSVEFELDEARAQLQAAQERIAQLEDEAREKDELLQEWDNYFVVNENKNKAFHSELRTLASQDTDTAKELTDLFTTLQMDEDFDAPLVEVDDSGYLHETINRSRSETRFDELMNRFKGMEQDL